MNMLEAWVHTPLAKTLGWTLFHFVWEGALIALVLGAVLFFCRPGSARVRYTLACLALLAMPVSFALTLLLSAPGPHDDIVASLRSGVSAANAAASLPASAGWKEPVSRSVWDRLPWVVPFWMAGVLLFYLHSLGGWVAAQRLRRAGVCPAPEEWRPQLLRLCKRLRISRPVVLLESGLTDVPVVLGFLRPAILVPAGLLTGFGTDQLEAILIHELAHVRRWDYAINLVQNFVEGLLFYHPAVWWISGLIRAERENCCDDVVVNLRGDARGYAAALAALEVRRWPARETALAATGGSLIRRIRRMLREPDAPRATVAPVFASGVLLASICAALAGWQTKPSAPPQPAAAQQRSEAAPVAVREEKKRPAAPLAQVQPSQDGSSLASDEERARFWLKKRPATLLAQAQPGQVRSPVATPYTKWLNEDVAYIITDEERAAFQLLPTDEEREHFIEQFWLRRDPTPGTVVNEFKEEHYRRIAYANEKFASNIPGWKTDRGRIYITYGPPDEKESHPSGGAYQRPAAEGGGRITTFPFEQWRYRHLEGVGNDIIIEFVDPTMSGEYRMTMDPSEKDALLYVRPTFTSKTGATVQVFADGSATISIPLDSRGDNRVNVYGRITTRTGRVVTVFEDQARGPVYRKRIPLSPGSYTFSLVVKDPAGSFITDSVDFEVK